MIVLDNIVFELTQTGGVSRYWSETIKELIKKKIKINFLEGKNALKNYDRKKILLPDQIIPDKGPILSRRFLNPKINSNIFHSSYYRTSKLSKFNVVTIHDFMNEKYPFHPRDFILARIKKNACKRADHIVVVSECTKNDLINFYPFVDPNMISVIPNGVSDSFFPEINSSEIFIQGNIIEPKNYFLYVGTRGMCKNFKYALSIFSEAKKRNKNHKLVIVSKLPLDKNEFKLANSLGINTNDLVQIEYVDNSLLRLLYSNCLALLIPSKYEGFGLPALESSKCGSIVIGAKGSALDEVVGESEYMINLSKKNEIKRVLDLDFYKEDATKESKRLLERSKNFSWAKSVSKLENIYKTLIKEI